jgi:hypothetical protein
MTTLIQNILARHDAGERNVAVIAEAESVSPGYVYGILRQHRPDRQRKPRERTSKKRKFILGLLAQGIQPPRVAFLAQCTPTYVYQLIEQEAAA